MTTGTYEFAVTERWEYAVTRDGERLMDSRDLLEAVGLPGIGTCLLDPEREAKWSLRDLTLRWPATELRGTAAERGWRGAAVISQRLLEIKRVIREHPPSIAVTTAPIIFDEEDSQ